LEAGESQRHPTSEGSYAVPHTTVGFNAADVRLLNPNGYYCIDTDQTGFGSIHITRTCQAEVAAVQTQATGFNSQNTTLVGCD
jgi:hypothetical protein